MGAYNVRTPLPLVKLKTLYPGQMGVNESDVPEGLRTGTEGKVIYVDPNYIGATTNPDGTDPQCPLSTVASALARCQDFRGDIILVMANDGWQYGPGTTDRTSIIAENVTVTVHGVSIIGVAPSSPVGVIWRPATAGGVACKIEALDVRVEGFAFCESLVGAGGGTGVFAEWDGSDYYGDNPVVANCYFGEGLDIGIQLEYVWNAIIERCAFHEIGYGIYCDPAEDGFGYSDIRGCWFQDCSSGAIAAAATGCDENRVKDCTVFNASAQGGAAATNEGFDFTNGDDNMVADCYFSCLLPVPANGDIDDLCSAGATDAWVANHCMNGLVVVNPT